MSALSPHFNHFEFPLSSDQRLLEDLLNEQVYLHGIAIWYIMRESESEVDQILGEDPSSIFQNAYKMAAWPQDVEDWSSGNEFFSKFGLMINKTTSINVTRRMWFKYATNELLNLGPREGDLVYIPIMQKLFEIKKREDENQYFVHNKKYPYYWSLQLEMFKYSHENIDTGVTELDNIEKENAYIIEFSMDAGSGNYYDNETVYQGVSLNTATAIAQVNSWSSITNTLQVYNIRGEFANGDPIIGITSGTTRNIADYDDLSDNELNRLYSNQDLQTESNTFIINTETNPFGSI